MQRFIVKNNTGFILRLDAYKMFLQPNQLIDLVQLTNKSIDDIRRDPYIKREISYNNLIVEEEFDDSPKVNELSGAINEILDILKNGTANQSNLIEALKNTLPQQQQNIEISNKISSSEEDDRMREEALMQMLSSQKNVEKKITNIGQSKEIKENEDFCDFLDNIDI